MTTQTKHFGLVLPEDEPPRASSIKRLVLFFDGVLLPAPDDDALIHDNEVIEKFPNGMRVEWTRRVPFIRTPDYAEQVHALIKDAELLCGRGILRVLPSLCTYLDPGINWTLYHLAISNPALVAAAAPDAGISAPPIQPPDGVYTGLTTFPSGYTSRYDVSAHTPIDLSGVHQQWHGIAWSRIGRALKFIRRAAAEGASPIAMDTANAAIASVLAGCQHTASPSPQTDSLFALALDVVDPISLEHELEDMPWHDILDLRRYILPSAAALRHFIANKIIEFARLSPKPSIDEYRRIMQQSIDDLRRLEDNIRQSWESLRLKVVFSAGKTVGLITLGEMTGFNVLTSSRSLTELLVRATAVGLIGASGFSSEIQKLVAARYAVKQHPFFFVHLLHRKLSAKRH